MSCADVPVLRTTTEMKQTGRQKRDLQFQTCVYVFVCVDNEILIFSSKASTAKEETPPLHLSPTRKHRLKIYNSEGMSEERSVFIRAIFPTVAH